MTPEYQAFKKNAQESMDKAILFLKDEFNRLKAGRANIVMVEDITFEAYGQHMTIKQAAALSVPDTHQIVIEPWDKSLLKDIEKGIHNTGLDFSVTNDGKILRINIPPLTEDRKKELVKYAKGIAEDAKIVIRNMRRDINNKLKEHSKEISEDDIRKELDKIQKETDNHIALIEETMKQKEKDIMAI
ncbi:ribosome recycling factor [Brevinema andersonii]|uniref:Ribosome-recycling factor n=1 Tax=Brevinema andersonii TaxID=34097 RepID=A0A1I1DXG9_BREAD|nr:ribosome recycling factor [Brevinema andersonii]SFB79759.1 ribosome recycling factor [Brevinema andersonii]